MSKVVIHMVRLPADLRAALGAQVDAYNKAAPLGSPRQSLHGEILSRLYTSFELDMPPMPVVVGGSSRSEDGMAPREKPRRVRGKREQLSLKGVK